MNTIAEVAQTEKLWSLFLSPIIKIIMQEFIQSVYK